MSNNTVGVKLHFPAGHRIVGLPGAGSKCRNIHGHTWMATWTFGQDDTWPPTVEFGEIKAGLGDVISEHLSHCFFVYESDPFLEYLRENKMRHIVTPIPPTTECIAETLAAIAIKLFPQAKLLSVLVEEGPENFARWTA